MTNEVVTTNALSAKVIRYLVFIFVAFVITMPLAKEIALSQACDRATKYATSYESLVDDSGQLRGVKTDYRWFDGCYEMINTSDHYYEVAKIF